MTDGLALFHNLDSQVSVGMDSAGGERFVAVFGNRPAMYGTAYDVLAACPPGSRIFIEGAIFTAATAADPAAKNKAFHTVADCRGIAIYLIGTRATKTVTCGKKTDWKDAAAIRWIGMNSRYPRRLWNPNIPPKFARRGMKREVMEIRNNRKLFAAITSALKTGLSETDLAFLQTKAKRWSKAAVSAIYYATTITTSRRDFAAVLGYTGLGAMNYCRGVIMQLWRAKKKKKGFVRAIRHARAVLRTTAFPPLVDSSVSSVAV